MKQKRPYACGVDAAVDVIDGKWKVLILWSLSTGGKRFGELKRDLSGVSEKVLIQQLRELAADELVHRRTYAEVVPRVEYSLTELGRSLNEALEPLGEWGARNRPGIEARRAHLSPERVNTADNHPRHG
ncbi:DNA-binding HxlR family transcriptional regulator [Saccharothrix tamanrassetensis]|uniref:DNA-binding HxlR family transcriptional regulator n=1 Tax=Saccharothrix tamanrassetensis TaxID=1051531 RepID=A0A841CN98_9PSEU|nr:helix-turn-helix domain-containing protein [Saccharothrix tamanrassetensis]MBB5957844.1 DNA-binding HxlR family transcriptional regulator [Saccharothrix tamanrassetensis]